MESVATFIIIFLIIIVIIFLVLREFWCWFWKINKQIQELENINTNLETIKTLLVHENYINFNAKEGIKYSDDDLPEL